MNKVYCPLCSEYYGNIEAHGQIEHEWYEWPFTYYVFKDIYMIVKYIGEIK